MEIKGTRALVTGAAGGLGTAISEELARRGARVVVSGRNEAGLKALADRIGGEVLLADLNDDADIDRLAGSMGEIDLFIANAGVGGDLPLEELDKEAIDFSLNVNLRSPILLSTAFAQAHLRSGTPGHVVLIGSLSGIAASPNTRMYNATKFGLRGFGLSLRQDLHGTGVGCSVVEPGFISEAGMFAESAIDLPPGVRTKRPEDVARAVAAAIEGDKGEVFVSPIELRLLSTLASVAPGFAETVQRKLGVAERKAARSS
jgi:short-subunit dehydrogenase